MYSQPASMFLYEYGTRYTLIEMREAGRRAGCDYFEMQRLLMKADAAVLRQYPYFPLFLHRADTEASEAGVGFPPDLTGAVLKRREELLAGAQRPPFLKEEDIAGITRILSYVRTGLMRDLAAGRQLSDPLDPLMQSGAEMPADGPETGESAVTETASPPLYTEYIRRYSECLQMMRRLNM